MTNFYDLPVVYSTDYVSVRYDNSNPNNEAFYLSYNPYPNDPCTIIIALDSFGAACHAASVQDYKLRKTIM